MKNIETLIEDAVSKNDESCPYCGSKHSQVEHKRQVMLTGIKERLENKKGMAYVREFFKAMKLVFDFHKAVKE